MKTISDRISQLSPEQIIRLKEKWENQLQKIYQIRILPLFCH